MAKSLSSMSVRELRLELLRRERRVAVLLRSRERLAARLLKMDRELVALGGIMKRRSGRPAGRPGRTGPRYRNQTPLHEALANVMKNRQMSIGEAIAAVRKAGYKSTARNFRLVVSVTLANKKRFRRVGRGLYRVR